MRVADAIVATLKAYGTEHFFMLTGGDPALWTALERAGIRMVSCRSEKGAAYMADGYARVAGRPGFVYGQHGPGAANLAAGLADAYWAMSPLISLTSTTPVRTRDRREYQQLDQLALNAPVTRWSAEVLRPEHAPSMVRRAIRVATGSRPGPVHLEVGRDILVEELGEVPIYAEDGIGSMPSHRLLPDPESVLALAAAIRDSRRPVLLAGGGTMLSAAWTELEALAEAASLPVATSPAGKGAIRETSPRAIGVVGRYAGRVQNEIMSEADLVVVTGSSLNSLTSDSFRLLDHARVCRIDTDFEAFGNPYREEVSLQADAKLALAALADQLAGETVPAERRAWADSVAERVAGWRSGVDAEIRQAPRGPIHPALAVMILREQLGPDDLLVADTGYMAAWTSVLYPVTAPGRSYLRSAGSLGWALPATVGAALASPGRRVVGVIGDGGAGYHITELETAVRLGVPCVIVVLNNRMFAFEYHVEKYLEGHVVPEVNNFTDIDYGAVARSLGAEGWRVDSPDAFREALAAALAAGRPALIDVVVDAEVHAPVTTYEHVLARTI